MKTPAPADLQRWSDEVARDPRSLAFLPLARAYRRQGLHDAALQLCLRGLEAYPEHVEAHGVLALLHLEAGDHQKAADEWSIVLRYDPDNFEAQVHNSLFNTPRNFYDPRRLQVAARLQF